jgi:hypothetical protein
MDGATLLVPRAEFGIENPWDIPSACRPVHLHRSTDNSIPRLGTRAAVYADSEYLNVVFAAEDDHVFATHLLHDAPLYEEDVVEIFIAPDDPAVYYEVEVNPLGTTFDARITSPDGVRSTMNGDVSWTCEGLFAAVRRTRDSLEVVMRIPFESLGSKRPANGAEWRANLFRVDRHHEFGDEYTAWQPTMRNPADFHVTAAFGTLRFT